MNKNLKTILLGSILTAFGVLLAVFGGATILNMVLAFSFIVIGSAMALVILISLIKKYSVALVDFIIAAILISVGVGLLTGYVNLDVAIKLMVLAILGGGAALVLYGVYTICKKHIFIGIIQILIGAICVALPIVYILVETFQMIFWIVVGVTIALYGAFIIISVIANSRAVKKEAAEVVTVTPSENKTSSPKRIAKKKNDKKTK